MSGKESWQRFLEAEQRELWARREGKLARLLMITLPEESKDELERMVEEDRRRAEEGLVELKRDDEVFYKHVDELGVEDMPARMEAEAARAAWLTERTRRVIEIVRGWPN
ncbi:MAG: hypothetical protein L0G70_04010 [Rubrobacter sp.]|nr:hypothetical protein [Rubrobacter sp.]